jgi:osmotically-inducible protein OsmY
MWRHWAPSAVVVALGVGSVVEPHQLVHAQALVSTTAQRGQSILSGPESQALQALSLNPVTAPYRFTTAFRDGKVVLMGRVGTKVVHDAAIRSMTSLGVPVDDQLVIDTAEVYRTANGTSPAAASAMWPVNSPGALAPFVYPPPLFGRYDDPFYGFVPPAISYPPYWAALSAHRLGQDARAETQAVPLSQPGPAPAQPPPAGATGAPGAGAPAQSAANQPDGTVEMTIDPRGVATLRGIVPTIEDKIAVGQKLASSPGVTEVINLINIREPNGTKLPARPPAAGQRPPPPPQPDDARDPADTAESRAGVPLGLGADPAKVPAGVAADGDPLSARLTQALARRPALNGLPIKVASRDGVASLSGKVPSVLQAMTAFRAVQQTPGVKSIVDSLEFPVPTEDGKNPLREQGRPEDVEPYLEAQIRRQVGDQAHIDRVRVHGDVIEVHGSLRAINERARIEALLRSIPLLRGFQIHAEFQAE